MRIGRGRIDVGVEGPGRGAGRSAEHAFDGARAWLREDVERVATCKEKNERRVQGTRNSIGLCLCGCNSVGRWNIGMHSFKGLGHPVTRLWSED